MCLVKHLEVYLGPSKRSAFAVIIRESLQEEVTHKGRTVFQGRNRQKDIRGRESPIGKSSPGPRGASKGRRCHSVGWGEVDTVRIRGLFLTFLLRNVLGKKNLQVSSDQTTGRQPGAVGGR